jgi:hypothetical protein
VAVGGVDIGVRLRLVPRWVELRDLGSDRGQKTDGERRRADREEHREEGKESELADPPPLGTA